MKKTKSTLSMTAAALLAASMIGTGAPTALADQSASGSDYIVSTRSFPKAAEVTKNIFAEATSTEVEEDSNWGGLGTMSVPETKSQAQIEEEERKKAEEEAQKQREAEEAAAAAQAQEQETVNTDQGASRSENRESLSTTSTSTLPSLPNGKTGADIASYAQQFVGYPYVPGGTTPAGWDCSGFVMYVYAQFGISLPRTSGMQANVGTAVGSLAEAQPGDIIANGNHAAIYIGNGLIMNALNPSQGTQVTGLEAFGGAGYSIRRVIQ